MGAALQGVRTPSVLSVSSRFGRFKRELLHDTRMPDVKSNPAIEGIMKAWTDCGVFSFTTGVDDCLRIVHSKTKGMQCSAEDIEAFSLALEQFQNENYFRIKAGFFLSALINRSEDTDFVIHTGHLNRTINHLGYQNTKIILVDGDVGAAIGIGMKCGSIIVKGSTGSDVGVGMAGGEIHIEGELGEIASRIIHGRIFHGEELVFQK